ncbi:MAG: nucleotide pyrophosphatase, partial [Burkholderiales bacterium]|nr:nucleotide pyrophosphatase [Burkholderiales bacterium]
HGGISDDDRHVAMLLSNPVLFPQPRQAAFRVSTAQLAPTMLDMLGLNPRALRAVRQQSVPELPDLR